MLKPKCCYFSAKKTDLFSVQVNLARNPKFLTDNRHDCCKSRVLERSFGKAVSFDWETTPAYVIGSA